MWHLRYYGNIGTKDDRKIGILDSKKAGEERAWSSLVYQKTRSGGGSTVSHPEG